MHFVLEARLSDMTARRLPACLGWCRSLTSLDIGLQIAVWTERDGRNLMWRAVRRHSRQQQQQWRQLVTQCDVEDVSAMNQGQGTVNF